MPRLTGLLRGYAPLETLADQAAEGLARLQIAVPNFTQAFILGGLLEHKTFRRRPVLAIAPDQEAAAHLEHDLAQYCADRRVLLLPPRGVWYGSEAEVQPRVAGRRARAVEALVSADGHQVVKSGTAGEARPPVVVTAAATLMEGVMAAVTAPLELGVGARHDFEHLTRSLVDLGYVRVDQVEDAGDFSVRGGLIDVFASTSTYPVRMEFWVMRSRAFAPSRCTRSAPWVPCRRSSSMQPLRHPGDG